ncbi:MAG: AhpC/TSA family protein [Bdellovibrionota bacterium]
MPKYDAFHGNLDDFKYGVVFDPEGRPVPISRFWDKTAAILIFLRHFGCIACRAHAQEVWKNRENVEKNGGRIIFIGNGAPNFIEGFKKDFNLENAPIFTDPTLKIFKMGGFLHGLPHLVNVQSLSKMAALVKEGHSNGNPFKPGTGNNFQMGGVIIIHPGVKVTYHYISESVGDTPDSAALKTNESE